MEQRPRPYLTAALLCEKVLLEKDECLTAVRILDKATIHTPLGELPEGTKPLMTLALLVAVKSQDPVGEVEIVVNAIRPNGESKKVATLPMKLPGGGQGQNYILNLAIGVEETGLHWFEVLCDGEILTKIPLTLELSKPEQATKPEQAAQ